MTEPIKFKGHDCCVQKSSYVHSGLNPMDDRTALILEKVETGEEVEVATLNMPWIPLSDREVIIKSGRDTEILDVLVRARIISVPKRMVDGVLPICNVLI